MYIFQGKANQLNQNQSQLAGVSLSFSAGGQFSAR